MKNGSQSVTNTLKVLKILRKNVDVLLSLNEIAEEIGCTKHMIRKYKDTLQDLGYDITTKTGKNGGMKINDIFLSEEELMILQDMLSNNKNLYKKIEYINSKI